MYVCTYACMRIGTYADRYIVPVFGFGFGSCFAKALQRFCAKSLAVHVIFARKVESKPWSSQALRNPTFEFPKIKGPQYRPQVVGFLL